VRRSWLRLFLSGVLALAAIAGWLVWSGTGARWVHRELETRVSRALERAVSVESVSLGFDGGLELALRNLRIQPTPDPHGEPLLRAGRVVASIDVPSLLIGRLALGTVVLEGPSLRLERRADGSFAGLPLPAFDAEPRVEGGDVYGEGLVRAVEALEPAARAAADRMRFLRRLELRDGTVSLLGVGRGVDAPPLRLELLHLTAERNRLSEAGAVDLSTVVVDGRNAPFTLRFGVKREEDQPFVWDLAWDGVSLAAARQLVPSLPLLNGLSGRWSAQLHAERDAGGASELTLASRVEHAALVLPRAQSRIEQPVLTLAARLELDRGEVRVRDGQLAGSRIRSDFAGTVERPLRPASSARLETRLQGVEFEDVRQLVDSIESELPTARSMYRLVERVESGRIEQIEAAGSATLRDWQTLWRGPDRALPADLLLSGRFDQVQIGGGSPDDVRDLAAEVEWIGDDIVLSNARARFRGEWLPRMDLEIEGVSHLVRATRKAKPIAATPPPIPGLRPLARILRPRDPNALPPVKAIGLAIDRLEHPLLRWPLSDARVLVEPVRRGVQIHVREGVLGGASVSGDVVYSAEADEGGHVTAHLAFGPAPASPAVPAESSAVPAATPPGAAPDGVAPSAWPAERWGAAEVEIEFRPRPRLPFARATGFVRLDGSELQALDVEIALAPQGTIETRGTVGLEDPDSIGLDLSFALTEGRFESLSEFVALPPALVTGSLGASGSLAGRVRPDRTFVAELDGRIRAEAASGRVALSVPLLLRLSKATEGYNPFANADEIDYETMSATLDLTHGVLATKDFGIEGPLRVHAKARLDTNEKPADIRAVVGIFLFRAPNQILSNVPILRSLLPGSERGLVGAYFRVDGAVKEPEIEALPLATFLTAVPSAIKTPMKVLQYLFDLDDDE